MKNVPIWDVMFFAGINSFFYTGIELVETYLLAHFWLAWGVIKHHLTNELMI